MIGSFVWQELLTQNAKATADFYCDLFGWTLQESPLLAGYYIISNNGKQIGAIMQMDALSDLLDKMPSHCLPYVAVANVDEICKKVKEHGGVICVEPTNIQNVGRFAVITDPAGVTMAVITLLPPPNSQTAEAQAALAGT